MTKQYTRATPIGYNTGKIMIGGHYIPQPKQMTANEFFIQGVLLGRSEASGLLTTITSQIKAKIRLMREKRG